MTEHEPFSGDGGTTEDVADVDTVEGLGTAGVRDEALVVEMGSLDVVVLLGGTDIVEPRNDVSVCGVSDIVVGASISVPVVSYGVNVVDINRVATIAVVAFVDLGVVGAVVSAITVVLFVSTVATGDKVVALVDCISVELKLGAVEISVVSSLVKVTVDETVVALLAVEFAFVPVDNGVVVFRFEIAVDDTITVIVEL